MEQVIRQKHAHEYRRVEEAPSYDVGSENFRGFHRAPCREHLSLCSRSCKTRRAERASKAKNRAFYNDHRGNLSAEHFRSSVAEFYNFKLRRRAQTGPRPGRAAINTTAMILCRDAGLHQLFSKLLSQNLLARGFVSDLGTLFELLERYLISEFSPFEESGGQSALNNDPQRLACAIGACVTNSELPDAKAEAGSPAIMQEGSFDAFFESNAFALFKEDLAEVVNLKIKNPRWEAQDPGFLLRGIKLEENLTANRRFPNIFGILQEPLRTLGLLEKPVAAGKRRVRWRCVSRVHLQCLKTHKLTTKALWESTL